MRLATAVVAVALITLALSGIAGAATSIANFENPDLDGAVITNQYAGVTFGKRSAFGGGAPNVGDCGAPTQRSFQLGHNGSRYGEAPSCGIEFRGSGTYAHFTSPTRSVSVWVGNKANVQRTVRMVVYLSDGSTDTREVLVNQGASWNLAYSHPTLSIAGIGLAFTVVGISSSEALLVDDLAFDSPDSSIQGTGSQLSAQEDTAFSGVVAHFTDTDQQATPGSYSATIAWGDGTTSPGSVTAAAGGGFDVSGSHTWPDPGSYGTTVTVSKPAPGQTAVFTGSATVSARPGASPTPTAGPAGPGASPTPTVGPAGPSASLIVAEKAPAGSPIVFDGSGSKAPAGKIVAYEWDFNGDGKYEANTGKLPSATFIYPSPGAKSAQMKVITDSGQVSTTKLEFTVDPSGPGCEPKLNLGGIRMAAACIKKKGTTYEITTDAKRRMMILNGVALEGARSLKLDLGKGTLTSEGGLSVQLNNTPLGDITLYRTKGALSWRLPIPGGLAARAATHSGSPGFRLATFTAGANCSPAERAACAKLPGGFPLTGQIDLFLNTKTFEMVIDAHAVLDVQNVLKVNGDVLLKATLDTGLKLDSLRFLVANAKFGVFTLEKLDFQYNAPGSGVPPLERDRWSVDLALTIPTPAPGRVSGKLVFVGGAFNQGEAELKVPGGIPVGPGILLNRFKGGVRAKPILITGGLGVSLLAVAQVDGDFLYERTAGGFAHVNATGRFRLLGQQLASAYFDYYSNGYLAFGGNFSYHVGPIGLDGNVGAWFEGSRFQAEGNVNLDVWIISASASVIVNNSYIAGCASIKTFFGRVGAYARYDIRAGNIRGFLGCDIGKYRIHPTRSAPATAAQAGTTATRFDVAKDERVIGLAVKGTSATPRFKLTGPDGLTFITPEQPGEITGVANRAWAAQLPENREVIIRVERPAAGEWRIEPLPGSAPIVGVESGQALPERPVTARVEGRGARRKLVYRATQVPGQQLRAVVRGKDSTQVLGILKGASGRKRFTAQDAAGRERRVEIIVEDSDGAPRRTVTVTRFRAPAPITPSRVKKVTLRRRGLNVNVRWTPSRGATRYAVEVRGSDGRRNLFVTRKRRISVHRVLGFERLTVTVRGERGPAGKRGRPRVARLKARR